MELQEFEDVTEVDFNRIKNYVLNDDTTPEAAKYNLDIMNCNTDVLIVDADMEPEEAFKTFCRNLEEETDVSANVIYAYFERLIKNEMRGLYNETN